MEKEVLFVSFLFRFRISPHPSSTSRRPSRVGVFDNKFNKFHGYVVKNPAAETAGRLKLNICFQCHSRLSGILPTVRDRKKDSGQARMTEIRNCGRDRRV